ncbi:heterokaryon incompatibility protein-domain-containing protein [Cercophora newfieldiana]|uniref:Heterokaryon incompatibility protein-domain-containing protein n=1 Tax=Cercophora newfieldiana TaxID=92897 RepID=A0AA40CUY1_9PEZI|nr:heterokaryon incompatibility protein-domain-containing protein [Cercophora newfieldiana]
MGPPLLFHPGSGPDPDDEIRNARAWYRRIELPPEDKSLNLCSRHRALALTWDQFKAWPAGQDLPPHTGLGSLPEIKLKSEYCNFCRLVYRAVGDVPMDGTDVVGCWIRDGEIAGARTTSLRMRIVPHQIGLEDTRLPFQPFDVVPFDSGPQSSQTPFFGRRLKERQIDFSLVRNWMQQCAHWHGVECRPSRTNWKAGSSADNGVPFIRLLDLSENCLIETHSPGPFVCLSYVWGRAPVFKTLQGNIEQLKQPGSLESQLNAFPRSIRDAIEVVKMLGERFLWVDSICIVQDDDDDKERQISVMDRVYETASLTLVLAGGDSADSGIGGLEDGSRRTEQNTAHYSGSLVLVQLLPNCNQAIGKSVWNSRGWTYQERLLSNRCLVFIDDTVYFQCHRATWGEDYTAEDMRMAVCAPMMDIELSLNLDPSRAPLIAQHRINTHRTAYFPYYCRLVEEYTSRHMSFETDRILGFEAVLNKFRTTYGLSFMYGLPEEMLHESLLWQPGNRMKRVAGGKTSWPMFPSWSWAGWIGAVEYNSPHDFNGLPPKPDIFHSAPPASNAHSPPGFSPYGIGLRTRIGQFRLIIDDRSGKPEPPGRPFYRFGISTSSPPSSGEDPWLGSTRLPGRWRRKYRDGFTSPFWFIVLSEAYGFGADELGKMAAKKREPYSVLNVMLVEKLQPSPRQNQLVVERLGVGRMTKDAWSAVTELADILIV